MKRTRWIAGVALAALSSLAAGSQLAAQDRDSSASAERCRVLANVQRPDLRITAAEYIDPGPPWSFPASIFNMRLGPNANTVEEFCRVTGIVEEEIRFELWMPPEWNDRYQQVGNGGLSGAINYPMLHEALRRGYAAASTDTGHQTPNAFFEDAWLDGPAERVENFGHRAHHLVTEQARALVAEFYGEAPRFSYFNGCSSGGWQGLTEAQLYPEDYDGILAGAPANNFVRLQVYQLWLDAFERRDPAGNLSDELQRLIATRGAAYCDPRDGLADGLVSHPEQCGFDPAVLQCAPDASGECLTPAQVSRVRLLYGPRTSPGGARMYPGNAVGNIAMFRFPPEMGTLAPMILKLVPPEEAARLTSDFDFDRDTPSLLERFGRNLGADDPDLVRFAARGGRMIVWHGWNDVLISPYNSIDYYTRVGEAVGAEPRAGFMRLYMAPGVEHCSGGPGPDRFDMLSELERWVEQGRAPERVVAETRVPGQVFRSRLLCPHPQIAVYRGGGSTDDAASFECRAPS
ncbi:MAG: tannase/feruloyl esterase family alpha/beta hydrolase [Sphingomonadaceae bacterium]|nr:tannase/feruloyl esterase family alpha/beta hydrolase [Sphingomonadaceae bacterium]